MDFKELLSLAKDNQSFNQKKFQRDLQKKGKGGDGNGVSDSAVKNFMAKKKKMEEQRKAAEEAERRKRIQERLEVSQGKNKPMKQKTQPKQASLHAPKPKKDICQRETTTQRPTVKSEPKVQKSQFQIPKKGVKETEMKSGKNDIVDRKMSKSAKESSKGTSSTSTVSTPENHTFKQYKRKKGAAECTFEWSGSIETYAKSPITYSKDNTKDKGSKKSALSFKELMNVAKQQKDKPAPDVAVTAKKSVADDRSLKDDRKFDRSSETSKRSDVQASKNSAPRNRPIQDNDAKRSRPIQDNDAKRSRSIQDKVPQQRRPAQCKLTTQTVDVRSNYRPESNDSYRRETGSSKVRNERTGFSGQGKGRRPIDQSRKRKISSVDDELEKERKLLERKRNMLRAKMQGGGVPQDDDYDDDYYDDLDDDDDDDDDDDLDGFIDDEGADVDYSRHIRSIFGYDRRKFVDDDDDDDCAGMEANYRQIAAEEARSARIAKLEDEIELRREKMMEEKEAKRRKK